MEAFTKEQVDFLNRMFDPARLAEKVKACLQQPATERSIEELGLSTASKEDERVSLELGIIADNAKIRSLGILLQLAKPSMDRKTRNDSFLLTRLMHDVGGIIQDYTDRISSVLSDLEYLR